MEKPKILLVDDEERFVKAQAARLNSRGIDTVVAFSGEECIQVLSTHERIDVVVLDVKMPGMDGVETLKEIKKIAPLTEVILLTGNATAESGIQGIIQGAYDYLLKPCVFEELLNKVRLATRKKRMQEDPGENWEAFMKSSTVKELMVPIAEYATVPEEANVLEAFQALETAQRSFHRKRYRHRAVLVLDSGGGVVGKINQHDIIQALEPQIHASHENKKSAHDLYGFSRAFIDSAALQYASLDRPLQNLYNKALQQKVKSYMHKPAQGEYVDVAATLNETIHRIIVGRHHSLLVTDGSAIVGIVRLTDVFELIHLRLKALHLAVRIGEKTPQNGVTTE